MKSYRLEIKSKTEEKLENFVFIHYHTSSFAHLILFLNFKIRKIQKWTRKEVLRKRLIFGLANLHWSLIEEYVLNWKKKNHFNSQRNQL